MRNRSLRFLLPLLVFLAGAVMHAQTPTDPLLLVSTTKVLAIGSLDGPLTQEQRKGIMLHEVPDTVKLYLAGKIDQWYVRKDGKGVVFLLNLSSAEEAKSLLDQLPLGQAKLMHFEFISLGPLSPLGLLLKDK